jgi:hypothetical protein
VEFVESVLIAAPPVRVVEAVADVGRWPDWTASMTSARSLDGGPMAVGARYEVRQPKLPVATWTVTSFDPAAGMVWESKGPGVRTVAEHLVAPEGEGSRLTLRLVQHGPLGLVIGRLYGGLTRRYIAWEADGFRRWCEQ